VLWFSYLFYFVCLCNATIRGERKITIISWLTITLTDTSRIIYLATTESIVKVSNYDKKVSRPRELSCMTYIRESDFWCTSVPSRA